MYKTYPNNMYYSPYAHYQNNPAYYSYPNVSETYPQTSKGQFESSDDRLIGGAFLAPFLLGGLTGAAVAPYFYRPYYYPYPYAPYGGYYW